MLLNNQIWSLLTKDEQHLLETSTSIINISKGQLFQKTSKDCTGVPFIISGQLRLYRSSAEGRHMNIHSISDGELCVLAALCILTNKPYDFSAVSEAKTTIALISPEVFQHLMTENKSFNQYILSIVSDTLIHALDLHERIHLSPVPVRLKNYILENGQHKTVNGHEYLIINKSHQDIAQDIGTSRVVVSRIISQWKNEKGVITGRKKIMFPV